MQKAKEMTRVELATTRSLLTVAIREKSVPTVGDEQLTTSNAIYRHQKYTISFVNRQCEMIARMVSAVLRFCTLHFTTLHACGTNALEKRTQV